MSDQDISLLSLVVGLACSTLLSWALGSSRGRGAFGFTLGLLLGPLGCLIVLLLPKDGRKCPFCLGVIPKEAVTCMHCAKDLGQRIPSVRD
jgi:hypothetical protein